MARLTLPTAAMLFSTAFACTGGGSGTGSSSDAGGVSGGAGPGSGGAGGGPGSNDAGLSGCDTCASALDFVCDEPSRCDVGTDCTDCANAGARDGGLDPDTLPPPSGEYLFFDGAGVLRRTKVGEYAALEVTLPAAIGDQAAYLTHSFAGPRAGFAFVEDQDATGKSVHFLRYDAAGGTWEDVGLPPEGTPGVSLRTDVPVLTTLDADNAVLLTSEDGSQGWLQHYDHSVGAWSAEAIDFGAVLASLGMANQAGGGAGYFVVTVDSLTKITSMGFAYRGNPAERGDPAIVLREAALPDGTLIEETVLYEDFPPDWQGRLGDITPSFTIGDTAIFRWSVQQPSASVIPPALPAAERCGSLYCTRDRCVPLRHWGWPEDVTADGATNCDLEGSVSSTISAVDRAGRGRLIVEPVPPRFFITDLVGQRAGYFDLPHATTEWELLWALPHHTDPTRVHIAIFDSDIEQNLIEFAYDLRTAELSLASAPISWDIFGSSLEGRDQLTPFASNGLQIAYVLTDKAPTPTLDPVPTWDEALWRCADMKCGAEIAACEKEALYAASNSFKYAECGAWLADVRSCWRLGYGCTHPSPNPNPTPGHVLNDSSRVWAALEKCVYENCATACDAVPSNVQECHCPDRDPAGTCPLACNDDGYCQNEDRITCGDCAGCDDDGACEYGESVSCADCACDTDGACEVGECTGNGFEPWGEHCVCADCADGYPPCDRDGKCDAGESEASCPDCLPMCKVTDRCNCNELCGPGEQSNSDPNLCQDCHYNGGSVN